MSNDTMHIHEVLFMMVERQQGFDNKTQFVDQVKQSFGDNARFSACSQDGMDAEDAFDFLIKKNKISVAEDGKVSLSPDMTMCSGHEDDHHHDHDHH